MRQSRKMQRELSTRETLLGYAAGIAYWLTLPVLALLMWKVAGPAGLLLAAAWFLAGWIFRGLTSKKAQKIDNINNNL